MKTRIFSLVIFAASLGLGLQACQKDNSIVPYYNAADNTVYDNNCDGNCDNNNTWDDGSGSGGCDSSYAPHVMKKPKAPTLRN